MSRTQPPALQIQGLLEIGETKRMKKLISYCPPASPRRIGTADVSECLESKLQELREAINCVVEKHKAFSNECEKSDLPHEIKRRIKLAARYNSKFNVFLNSVVLSPDGTDTDDMQGFTNYAAFIEEWRNFDFDENQKRLRERAAKLMPELAEAFLRRPSPKL